MTAKRAVANARRKPKVRLLKVRVQAVVVVEQPEGLEERVTEALEVPAARWGEFAKSGINRSLAAIAKQVEAENANG